jgi:hypothetical protein
MTVAELRSIVVRLRSNVGPVEGFNLTTVDCFDSVTVTADIEALA